MSYVVCSFKPAKLAYDSDGNLIPKEELEYSYRKLGYPIDRRPKNYR